VGYAGSGRSSNWKIYLLMAFPFQKLKSQSQSTAERGVNYEWWLLEYEKAEVTVVAHYSFRLSIHKLSPLIHR
jgi:hypothetical protein